MFKANFKDLFIGTQRSIAVFTRQEDGKIVLSERRSMVSYLIVKGYSIDFILTLIVCKNIYNCKVHIQGSGYENTLVNSTAVI